MVLGTMTSSFNTTIDNHPMKPVGITDELPGPIPDTHMLEWMSLVKTII